MWGRREEAVGGGEEVKSVVVNFSTIWQLAEVIEKGRERNRSEKMCVWYL